MTRLKILRLSQARVLLWAREGDNEPFEVSKVVSHPLQPLCPSAPRCPSELEGELGLQNRQATWVDPLEPPVGSCPYEFGLRRECLRHRNQVALQTALFLPNEVCLTRRLLKAVGYSVSEEAIDPAREPSRILKAHGYIGSNHQVRLMKSPAAGTVVLVRELAAARAQRSWSRRLRVLPVGGNR